VLSFAMNELEAEPASSPHATSLPSLLRGAAFWGVELPAELLVVAVEAEDLQTMGGEMSPSVSEAVTPAVATILELLASASGATPP
jgi:hydrogenase maturation protease